MRLVLLLLILTNVVYAAWSHNWLAPLGWAAYETLASHDEPIAPEKIHLISISVQKGQ